MKNSDLRIVFMGTPEFAVASLDALYREGFSVCGVVTVADKPAGRGRHLQQSAVKQWAVAHDTPLLQPAKLTDPQFLSELAALGAQLFVVVAFRMLPAAVWQMPLLGTFNLHASLLPMYRGAAPINHAVINGETITGLTTFMLDHDLDTGKILFQEQMVINDDETAGQLHDRMMQSGASLVVRTCQALQMNAVSPLPQTVIAENELKGAPKIFKTHCRIDLAQSTTVILNQIRGLSPYPAAFISITISGHETGVLKIFKAHATNESPTTPGMMRTDGKSFLSVACADGWIHLDEVQLSGRKPMAIVDFLRGFNKADQLTVDQS